MTRPLMPGLDLDGTQSHAQGRRGRRRRDRCFALVGTLATPYRLHAADSTWLIKPPRPAAPNTPQEPADYGPPGGIAAGHGPDNL
jgi:hypothetical protein